MQLERIDNGSNIIHSPYLVFCIQIFNQVVPVGVVGNNLFQIVRPPIDLVVNNQILLLGGRPHHQAILL
jgi:hypothetical protein